MDIKAYDNEYILKIADNSTAQFYNPSESILDGLVVASGQLNECLKVVDSSSTHIAINAKCGRHGSEEVARQWNNLFLNQSQRMSGGAGATNPSKLNFYFRGVFTILLKGDDDQHIDVTAEIYFAQGQTSDGNNNWWVGSNCNVDDILLLQTSNSNRTEQDAKMRAAFKVNCFGNATTLEYIYPGKLGRGLFHEQINRAVLEAYSESKS